MVTVRAGAIPFFGSDPGRARTPNFSRNSAREAPEGIKAEPSSARYQKSRLSTHPPNMLKTDSHPTDRLVVPSLDFDGFFKKYYSHLPSIEDILKTGGYLGCCGARFTQHSTGLFKGSLFGEEGRDIEIVWWKTTNFKNKEIVCAKAVFEQLSDGTWYLWSLFFTTCDPFSFDNFTHPLGLDLEAKRATFDKHDQPSLSPDLPPTEYYVFAMGKINFHMNRLVKHLDEEGMGYLRTLLDMAVTRLDSNSLRAILQEHARLVPTFESFFYNDQTGVVAPDIDPNEVEQAKEAELKSLRRIIRALELEKFGQLYREWLDDLLDAPTNLVPSKYKAIGRSLLMTKEDLAKWDELVFLLMMSTRANLITQSPIDTSIGLGSTAACFAEVSDVDARFAEKTPKKDVKLGDVSNDWIIAVTEKVVVQQRTFLEEFKLMCDAGDIEAAFCKLTKGTAEPKEGQGLLGLSIACLRDFMTKAIVMPEALIAKITRTFEHYGLPWSLPLLPVKVDPDATYGADLLLLLGNPVRG